MDYVMTEEEQEIEKEKARAFIQFFTTRYASPSMGEESPEFKRGRDQFLESITPDAVKKAAPAESYDWNYELLDKLAASQKGG